MTGSRERMRVAMARGRPERTPLMCQLALGHYFLNTEHDAIDIWHDSEAFALALVELQRRYAFDGILVNLPGRDPGWRDAILEVREEAEGLRRIHWKNGTFTLLPPDDNPHVFAGEDDRGLPSFEELDPERLFYVEPHDLSGVKYPWSWGFSGEPAPLGGPEFFPEWQLDTLRRVLALTEGKVSVHGEVFSPFSQLMELLDHTVGLMSLVLDPGKVRAILERLTEGAICLGRMYGDAGCDALLVSSAFVGGGFLSRDHYERFELPYLRQIVRELTAGHPELPVYVHTCGAIGDRLDLIEASGLAGIDSFDPPPIGNVELADAVERLGQRLFIKGNLDPVNTLLLGTREHVRAAALERLATAAGHGAYILSTACSVPPRTPPENVLELRAAVEEAG